MKTVWLEFTDWRGFWIDRTLLGNVLRLGWIGIGASRWNLTDFFKQWHDTLRTAVKGEKK